MALFGEYPTGLIITVYWRQVSCHSTARALSRFFDFGSGARLVSPTAWALAPPVCRHLTVQVTTDEPSR
jgi:hypothetical protein